MISHLPFNTIDYVIICFLALSIIVSLFRGFVRESISLVTWFIAAWLGLRFAIDLAEILVPIIHSPTMRYVAAFVALFLIALIVGALINWLCGELIAKTGLTGTDRVLGVVFGFLRGVLLVSIVLLAAELTPLTKEDSWKRSVLIPKFYPVEVWLHGLLPHSVSDQFVLVKDH